MKEIEVLQESEKLDDIYCDHSLIGNWDGYRECHITADWLLIYRVKEGESIELLELARTGSHSELFN